ncbi:MAG: FkbM family methyltransferase [Bacteroidales bacterium]|nr:FkbM family methyltransferase [Bacteroidales bacterium]
MAYKLTYFPLLHLLYRLPISYDIKKKMKKKWFFDKFARCARDNFFVGEEVGGEKYNLYDVGLFKLSLILDNQLFPLENLEWNLAHEYLDIVGPSLSPFLSRFIIGEGPYESGVCVLEKGDVVVDAGGNIGMFAFLAAQKVSEKGQVHAIEPIPYFQKCIETGIRENHLDNVSVHGVALGKENKECIFQLSLDNPGETGHGFNGKHPITVTQTTLDSLVFKEKKIDRVDFIKMDIEGSEREALQGAMETIRHFKPKMSICTYHLDDDPVVLPGIIKDIDPTYTILMGRKKLYAFV